MWNVMERSPGPPEVFGRTAILSVPRLTSDLTFGVPGEKLLRYVGESFRGCIRSWSSCGKMSLRLFCKNLKDLDLVSMPGMLGFTSASGYQVGNEDKGVTGRQRAW